MAQLLELSFHGWFAGVYGSVLSGSGRDADILLTPWLPAAIPPIEMIEAATRTKRAGELEGGSMAVSCILLDADGHIFDLRWTYPYLGRAR